MDFCGSRRRRCNRRGYRDASRKPAGEESARDYRDTGIVCDSYRAFAMIFSSSDDRVGRYLIIVNLSLLHR